MLYYIINALLGTTARIPTATRTWRDLGAWSMSRGKTRTSSCNRTRYLCFLTRYNALHINWWLKKNTAKLRGSASIYSIIKIFYCGAIYWKGWNLFTRRWVIFACVASSSSCTSCAPPQPSRDGTSKIYVVSAVFKEMAPLVVRSCAGWQFAKAAFQAQYIRDQYWYIHSSIVTDVLTHENNLFVGRPVISIYFFLNL